MPGIRRVDPPGSSRSRGRFAENLESTQPTPLSPRPEVASSEPHKSAHADVAPDGTHERAPQQQVAGEARDERGIVRERDERDVVPALLLPPRTRALEQSPHDRRRDDPRPP